MKKKLTFLFFISFAMAAAQSFELGSISVEELQEKQHPKDTAAVAAILFNKGITSFENSDKYGEVLRTVVKTRIKIYKKEGYSWATKALIYSSENSSKESLSFSKAVTYNLVDGKIETSQLEKDGVFDEKVDKNRSSKKITLPNVKEGTVLEYEYTIVSPNLVYPRDWVFQATIPVNYSEYKIIIPEFYKYNVFTKGFISPSITYDTVSKKVPPSYFTTYTLTGARISNLKESVVCKSNITKFIAKDIPALKEESFVNNIDNYTSSVSHELAIVQYPGFMPKIFATDWYSVVKNIYRYSDFGPELDKTGYFDDELKKIVSEFSLPEEKMMAVYNFVKTNIKWNGKNGYYSTDGLKNAFKNKTGNVGDVNLMLTAMLRFVGLEANPVLVSTRDNGIALYPSQAAFNYVIAAIETPKGRILLDATEESALPNILPIRDLNWKGRLIRKDGTSEEVDLMPKVMSNDNVAMNYSIEASGKVIGKLHRVQNNYNALLFRNQIVKESLESYLENLEREKSTIQIEDYKRSNEKVTQEPVTESYSFSSENLTELVLDKIYLNPLLFYTYNENPLKLEQREYPIDYSFPFTNKYTVEIKIPDGFVVESIPAPIQLAIQDDLGGFKLLSSTKGNTIQIVMQHQIKASIVTKEYYQTLKEYYQKMIGKMNEKVVLKKA